MAQIKWNDIKQPDTYVENQIPMGDGIDFISEPHVACCLLLDTSGSMEGEKIKELNEAIIQFQESVCQDSTSAKRVDVSMVEFNSNIRVVTPFCPILKFKPPQLVAYGATNMATGVRFALEAVHKQVSRYHRTGIECYKPFVLMITDGRPTESMEGIAELIQARESQGRYGHLRFHAIGVKGADMDLLSTLTKRVLAVDQNAFDSIFDWTSRTMQIISHSQPWEEQQDAPLGDKMYPYNPIDKKLPWND